MTERPFLLSFDKVLL